MIIFVVIVMMTIIFGIVLFFLKKIVWGDTQSAVHRLEESYEEIKKKKEEVAQRLSEIEEEYRKKKQEADNIVQELKEKAQKEYDEIRLDAFRKAKVESEDIISKAQKTVEKIKEHIHNDLETKFTDYCAELLKCVFSNMAQESLDRILAKEFIEELLNMEVGHINIGPEGVDLLSARPFDEVVRKEIKDALINKFKKEIPLSEKLDEKLIAGVQLRFGSLVLDGSLAAKLKEAALNRKQKIEERSVVL